MAQSGTGDRTSCDGSEGYSTPQDTFSTPRKPGTGEETPRQKARRMWKLLYNTIRSSMVWVKHSCFNPTLTTHGIQHICHFSSNSPVRHVTYNQATGDFVSLSSDGTLRVYQCEGRLRASFPSAEPFSGIASTVLPDRYAAWGPGNRLAVLDREFRTISSTCSSRDIHTCLSKEGVYELVVGGAGHVSVWCLRHLVCRVEITEGLGTRDVFTELVLPKAASPKSQRCFAMSSAGVALFHLSKGMLLAYKKDLHLCNITGIAYCNTAKSLATASRDGTIKVWDEDWGVQMVFAGHTGAVTALAACPHLPHFFSSSLDGTLRVWSLETGDQLEKIHTGPALGLGMKSTEKDGVERLGKKASRLLCSYSRKGVDFWALTHLYALHTPLGGAPIREIQTVSLPLYPTRMLCVSDDGTIRLIAAETGEVITTFILEEGKRTKWVDYCLPWETLFVLTEEGEVLRINTLTNPATLLKQGARPRSVGGSPVDAATTESGLGKRKAKACCLVVYNYIVDPEKAFSCWTEVVENGGEKRKRKPKEIKQERNRYMLIVGQEDGFLAVLDWYSGQIQYQTEAHSSQAVTGLVTNLENNYIISAGGDRSVKAWRVFPYAEESLSLQVTFFCGQPPLRISVMDSLLAVAFQDFSSATYSIVQFNLLTKRRTDHSPNDDPQDKITGLCTCPRMKIFASSSLDGIIRIWDRDNGLIRSLCLNAAPESLAFCSMRGDLLVGIDGHLHWIHHTKFLPRHYLYMMMCMEFSEPIPDPPIPVSEAVLQSLSPAHLRKLKGSLLTRQRKAPPLAETERAEYEEYERELRERAEAYAMLAARDRELLLLKQGELQSRKKPKGSKSTKKEAFRRYLHLLHLDRPQIQIPDVDLFDLNEALRSPRPPPPEAPYIPKTERGGFFPDHALARHSGPRSETEEYQTREKTPEQVWRDSVLPVLSLGFIPNSVLAGLLWPPEILDKGEEVQAKTWKLPARADNQLDEIKYMEFQHHMGSMLGSEDDDEDEDKEMELLDEVPVKADITRPSPEPLEEKPPQNFQPKTKLSMPRPKPVIKPRPHLSPTPPPRKAAPVRKTSSHALPVFILQFVNQSWFQLTFSEKSFSETMTLDSFMKQLMQQLKTKDYCVKTGILGAVQTLLQQEGLEITMDLHNLLLSILNQPNPPTLRDPDEREFIHAALTTLVSIAPHSKELLVEIMVQLIFCDEVFRKRVESLWQKMDLEDPHDYLGQELSSWDEWPQGMGSAKTQLRKQTTDWLNHWIAKYKIESKSSDCKPIEAVNYFCSEQHKKWLVANRPPVSVPLEKNTVLLLPDIRRSHAILRLGETNSMARTRPVEYITLPPISSRPLLSGFVPYMAFPLPKVNLCPFTSPEDPAKPDPSCRFLGAAPRYFFLEHSYADNYK
ncbi:WD repeat-containing protein 97-like [Huso huso]|uniref:WD repeat-containing protein 97-like n=1 Tax=Huso huso TaxID=61971 RepID=A0ABR1A025_HUSHU